MKKSKIKKHVFGYDIFEQNVPFTQLEEGDVLLTTENDAKRNHNWSFIRMNDDYIELIDQSYARLGKSVSMFIFISPLWLFAIGCLIYFLTNPFFGDGIGIYVFIILVYLFFIIFVFYVCMSPYFKYDHKQPICKPILFNRKTGKVFFYVNDQEYIERNWTDVVYIMGSSFGLSGIPLRELRAHIVENGILKHTFVIGFPMIGIFRTQGLWSFICHFMMKGPEELYPKPHPMYGTIDPFTQLTYCQNVQDAKESWKETWRSFRIIYHYNWVPALFSYPFDVCNFIARRILLHVKPIPVWHEDVIKKNKMDQERPEEMRAKDNFEFTMFKMKDK